MLAFIELHSATCHDVSCPLVEKSTGHLLWNLQYRHEGGEIDA